MQKYSCRKVKEIYSENWFIRQFKKYWHPSYLVVLFDISNTHCSKNSYLGQLTQKKLTLQP